MSFWHIVWTQINYRTIKKEILTVLLCMNFFQDNLFCKKFLLQIDCKFTKFVFEKDVKNIVLKQIFAR